MGDRALEKLLAVASEPRVLAPPLASVEQLRATGPRVEELLSLLKEKNGFFAFESALHVFPVGPPAMGPDLLEWNAASLWRDRYPTLDPGCLFFAEDVFGGQFCILDDAIHSLDPETGAVEHVADDLASWCDQILEDHPFLTGYPVAHEWQAAHGRLSEADRLTPIVPFVLGGDFTVDNLEATERSLGMRRRGSLASQIHDLPDGAEITVELDGDAVIVRRADDLDH